MRVVRAGGAALVVLMGLGRTSVSLAQAPTGAARILVDEGHHNYHRTDGTLAGLTWILGDLGHEVVPLRGPITAEALHGFHVFLSGNPFPAPREELVKSAVAAGEPFRFHTAASRPAFHEREPPRWRSGCGTAVVHCSWQTTRRMASP